MNGDLNFEEGGNSVQMNRIIAGKDPVLIDAYAANLLGFEIDEVPYIGLAEKIGVGSADLVRADIVELSLGQIDRSSRLIGKLQIAPQK